MSEDANIKNAVEEAAPTSDRLAIAVTSLNVVLRQMATQATGTTGNMEQLANALGESSNAAKAAATAFKSGSKTAQDIAFEVRNGDYELSQFGAELNKSGNTISAFSASVNMLTVFVQASQTAFAAAADLYAGNIDELVNVYSATINVISSQNRYTQALALNAVATKVFGASSEQASRTTIAASYTSALYTQAKKNEAVAQFNYATATAKNLATISSSIVSVITAFTGLQTAMTMLSISAILNSEKIGMAEALAMIPIVGSIAGLVISAIPLMNMPHAQGGGLITETGPIYAHAGEIIKTTEEERPIVPFAPKVEFNITATSNVDLPKVQQSVERGLSTVLLHAQKQRGVYG